MPVFLYFCKVIFCPNDINSLIYEANQSIFHLVSFPALEEPVYFCHVLFLVGDRWRL